MIRPLRLVSLWEMLRNYARFFANWDHRCLSYMEEIDLRMAHGGTTLGDQFCGELREEIALVAGWARSVDLDVFLVKAERMQRVLSPTSSLRKAHGDLRDLRERIVD